MVWRMKEVDDSGNTIHPRKQGFRLVSAFMM